ncbi:hypothetical protein ElyMa_002363800 [Elysia marginata]|uniref:Uncharacterized protein n=1 Tax=Elysia marginata TaxID=1093978 RepID=A0AAV4GBM0_9GAST|nr:hypothetical protein ElyMa_002363800 [Elysia marginata]
MTHNPTSRAPAILLTAVLVWTSTMAQADEYQDMCRVVCIFPRITCNIINRNLQLACRDDFTSCVAACRKQSECNNACRGFEGWHFHSCMDKCCIGTERSEGSLKEDALRKTTTTSTVTGGTVAGGSSTTTGEPITIGTVTTTSSTTTGEPITIGTVAGRSSTTTGEPITIGTVAGRSSTTTEEPITIGTVTTRSSTTSGEPITIGTVAAPINSTSTERPTTVETVINDIITSNPHGDLTPLGTQVNSAMNSTTAGKTEIEGKEKFNHNWRTYNYRNRNHKFNHN